jgi:hypothetical protein
MVLSEQASERCRRIFQAYRNHEGWTDATFSHRLAGAIPQSTLSRLLNTVQRFSTDHLFPLARLLSERLPCDFGLLWSHLVSEQACAASEPPPAVLDLESATVYGIREAAIRPLLDLLAGAENTAKSSRLFTRVLPATLLTLPVMKKLYRHLAEVFGGDVESRYELMLSIGTKRRSAFLKTERRSPAREQILIPDSVANRLVLLEPPFHTCTRDEIDELIEGLIFDALRDRGTAVAIIGTLPGSIGYAIDNYFSRFDSVIAFEDGPVLKRPRGKACVYHCAAEDSGTPVHRALARDQAMLRLADFATSCSLDDLQGIEKTLRQLLSIDSWADRARHAHLYRLPQAG